MYSLLCAICLMMAVAGDGSELDRAIVQFETMDETVISLSIRDERLERALEILDEALPGRFRGDWAALDSIGVDRRQLISLHLEDVRGLEAMQALCLSLGDDVARPVFEAAGGQMVLTTVRGAVAMRSSAVYDVSDLLDHPMIQAEADVVIVDPSATMPDDDRPTPHERLVGLLLDHVDPEAWIDYGGSRAKVSMENGVMVVSAAPSVHRSLRRLIAQMRATNRDGWVVSLALVEVSGETDLALDTLTSENARALRKGGRLIWETEAVVVAGRAAEIGSTVNDLRIEATMKPVEVGKGGTALLEFTLRYRDGTGEARLSSSTKLHPDGLIKVLSASSSGGGGESKRFWILSLTPSMGGGG